ncbi:uncharacterized protein AC631_05810 [Debaryomyces fabryi]|uniref:Ornithine aminotransferase n=1 Tax=Debaryomyces fabryi TaxID=58627 RepID=A0A0V1PQC1_9ASCO|nr:uncharacterized protein AC631_05810 [Debaryomyces fabryi]KRZ98432.1 hypothetical protein AC631_05810 [Debaryomyces fabryi]CUM45787.1 unnamed protein product [Debaryomyces fabryi]
MSVMGMDGTRDGVSGDHFSVAPTFILSEADVEFIVDTLLKSVTEVEEDLTKNGNL